MEASILFGFKIVLHDECSASCSFVPDLVADQARLHTFLQDLKLNAPLAIFVSTKSQIYIGVEIPSAWHENADMGPTITFDEQLMQTNQVTWHEWFDAYYTLQDQAITFEEHNLRIKCQNETPCLFATIDITKIEPLPPTPQCTETVD